MTVNSKVLGCIRLTRFHAFGKGVGGPTDENKKAHIESDTKSRGSDQKCGRYDCSIK